MEEEFTIGEAKKFAKIVHFAASKYDNLKELEERLESELKPYAGKNRILFVDKWKDEIDVLFYDHLQKCKKPDCPQHKTSKNVAFLVSQFHSNLKGAGVFEPAIENSDRHDLNYYFNATNIPNQELVFETYNYFEKGDGKEHFQTLEFLNLLNWHYRFVRENIERPFDVIGQFKSIPFTNVQQHILISFILKWYGGSPVNNLNAQFNTTLKFLESEYRQELEVTTSRLQEIINLGLSGENLSNEQVNEERTLRKNLDLFKRLDKLIDNTERTKRLNEIGKLIGDRLNILNDENIRNTEKEEFIFISHSSKDEQIVALFIDKILQLALQINLNKIFCTSIQAMSITSGENFRKAVRENLMRASHVIQIITRNYKESEVCLNEMGAAWVLNSRVIPFILNPIRYDTVGFIHEPIQQLKLDDENDLMKFIDEMTTTKQNLKLSEVKRHVGDFIMRLGEITKE